jgi:hypothetical protein
MELPKADSARARHQPPPLRNQRPDSRPGATGHIRARPGRYRRLLRARARRGSRGSWNGPSRTGGPACEAVGRRGSSTSTRPASCSVCRCRARLPSVRSQSSLSCGNSTPFGTREQRGRDREASPLVQQAVETGVGADGAHGRCAWPTYFMTQSQRVKTGTTIARLFGPSSFGGAAGTASSASPASTSPCHAASRASSFAPRAATARDSGWKLP